MPDEVVADYGELGPEHFDRFGVRHYVDVDGRTFMDADPRGPVRRMGLKLISWFKTNAVHATERYVMTIDDRRVLEIRSHVDGRLKIFLDNRQIYAENVKMVTRKGQKYREVVEWFDPEVERFEHEAKRQFSIEEVRARLDARLRETLESRK